MHVRDGFESLDSEKIILVRENVMGLEDDALNGLIIGCFESRRLGPQLRRWIFREIQLTLS
jgi:hypothetical protein